MTPEEKAKDIYLKYYTPFSNSDSCFGYCDSEDVTVCDHTGHGCGLWVKYAKQCAIIAVKEILNIEGNYLIERGYWQQVKEAIQSL